MEERDFIYIYDKDGKKIKMELVFAMNSEDGESQYIVYKEIDKIVPVYMAKIKLSDGIIDLDTDLTKEEKSLVEKMFKEKIIGEAKK